MSKVFVVDDGGCNGIGCCVETKGVFSSINAVKQSFPDLKYVPFKCGHGQLIKDDSVEYYVYEFEMDICK